ncbi:MAG: response regulator [Rhodospirillaceae bacterium]|nr:response regulator [Rhodospirillaceae bacterium]
MALVTTDYLKPITFLVVDDKSYMRRVIKSVLETLGAKSIEEATSGREAMDTIRQWPPDIVLTEFWMTPMNGVEMLRAVRTDKGPLRFTPIIMVTAETRREKVIGARNAGVTEYIAKPITAKGMLLRIREVIKRPRPFVDTRAYFGPDRRRRTEVMAAGQDRRGIGERPPPVEKEGNEGLTQEQINRLVAGDSIKDFGNR